MVVISIIIRKDLENCSAFTCQVNVNADFDTIEKALSSRKGLKKA